jgi:hypothetical protein
VTIGFELSAIPWDLQLVELMTSEDVTPYLFITLSIPNYRCLAPILKKEKKER